MWQRKAGTVMQPEIKGLLSTRSAIYFQSSVAAELILQDRAVRHAISGNDIISLKNSDTGECYLSFRFSFSLSLSLL